MKNRIAMIVLGVFAYAMTSFAQIQDTTASISIPGYAKWMEIGLLDGYQAHYGYIYELDSASMDMLKVKYYNNHPNYSHFQLPISHINYIKVTRAKNDRWLGAAIGSGVGLATGLLIVAAKGKSKACNEEDWYFGQMFDCTGDLMGRMAIVTGTTVGGAIVGGVIGCRVGVTIPIHGSQLKFESARPKLMPYVILQR